MGNNAKIFLLLVMLHSTSVGEKNVWKIWERELHQQCPENHVNWIGDGGYDGLLGDFIDKLPVSTQRKISGIADYSHRCLKETAGFSCEMAVHPDAFNKLGLMKQFTAFGCDRYKCEEPALCTRLEP